MSQKDGCISVKRSLSQQITIECNVGGVERGIILELHNKNVKKILLIILFAIVTYAIAQNMGFAAQIFSWIVTVLSPFIIGLCLAFILNVPLKFLEETVFTFVNRKGLRWWDKWKRGICLTLTYLLVILLVLALCFLVVPELKKSFSLLVENLPGYMNELELWIQQLMKRFDVSTAALTRFTMDWDAMFVKLGEEIQRAMPNFLNGTMDMAAGLVGGVFNFIVGIAFSTYMLLQKEKLCQNVKKVFFAFFSRHKAETLVSVGKLSNEMFAKFVSGQLTEAVIIGLLCFLGMSLFSIPYAPLIATIVSVTALIPIFGAFIGTAFGAFLLLMARPVTALWFVLFIIVLQQIEGNFIYPKVVGGSIGLPGIWVLFSVTLGGNLFGVMGMLLGVPISAVLYTLLRQSVFRRLKEKKISDFEIRRAGKKLN